MFNQQQESSMSGGESKLVDGVAVEESVQGGRLTKADWMNLAVDVLVKDGIDHVKIQAMAKELGVARSSFYWFFSSAQDLFDQLLAYWLTRNTGPIIERAMRPAATVTRAVLNVFECWIDRRLFDPSLDVAIRFWGRRDAAVRAVVEEADQQRIDALTRMFRRYGIEEEEALTRARVLYYTQIGHFTLEVRETLAMRLTHVRSYLLTFTGTTADPKEIKAFEKYAAAVAKAHSSTSMDAPASTMAG